MFFRKFINNENVGFFWYFIWIMELDRVFIFREVDLMYIVIVLLMGSVDFIFVIYE